MKTLKTLNVVPELSEDHSDLVAEGRKVKIQTIKRMLRDAIALSTPKNMDSAEEREQLRMKLMLVEDEIQIEDAEFKLLKEIVELNPCGWVQHYYNQVAKVIREAGK